MKKRIQIALAVILSVSVQHALAGIAVVVGASSPIEPISKEEDIVKVFLGKKKTLSGSQILPVDQTEGSPTRSVFYKDIVKKTETQLTAYWARLIFTGKAQAPQSVGGDNDVKNVVATNPNLIGYIDEGAIDDTVKVIFKK
ncbi:phosphate ABC transporter substrate-binding protein [Marinibactrum halimedae]|uniref:Phosphate ABC transporter substrate-binding protein n=1 Tax=Marinibactrum halimedae TaxID=1444977 RepID=A0AA37T266_9GAMM|nr:phosphate ABC transporter substrate-binding protein [Marinibactrum halimedae]MCD9457674.1 phosphate ABC transporter substrate-binding protein [Marinibactrum halimedae]GLS24953.1 hypothetical protein GCM10007877_06670 [Marinibactrum halimedae]